MKNLHFAILAWRDFAGFHHACWVEDRPDRVATAPTREEAVRQVRDYLAQRARRRNRRPAPDLIEPQIVPIAVEVRPEYRAEDRAYPCDESVRLSLACVRGRREGGMWVCLLPMLGLSFEFYEPAAMKRLVDHYVRDRLSGLTPQELSRHLPPPEVGLEEVVIRVPGPRRRPSRNSATDPLAAVLDPLPARSERGAHLHCWERDHELNDLVKRLTGERASVVVVAEPGGGKTALIVEAVRRAARLPGQEDQDDPSPRYYRTSAARIIAGMKYLGQWQARCEEIVERLRAVSGVLCVENLLDLVGSGGAGPTDGVAAFLQPFVERGELRLIGEASPAELDALRRLLPGFADLFQVLRLAPFSRSRALAVLTRCAATLNMQAHLEVDPPALACVQRLFERFEPYAAFPGQAVRFVQGLFEHARRHQQPRIDANHATARFSQVTGLPELILRDEVPLPRAQVLAALEAQVIGQGPACATVASVILALKAGLNDPNRPLGVLLFCGPTGVGKTQLAKALARFLFEHGPQRSRLIRLDMSEYTGPFAVARLLGEAHGPPGALVRQIRQQPFAVVLLDEIEKADSRVFDALLRVFDEGRLTDNLGRMTYFTNTVLIMTSNLGAGGESGFGFNPLPATSYFDEALRFFRPEFVNRIDAVVNFAPLSDQTIRAITIKELTEIAGREGLVHRNLKLTWSEDVVGLLSRRGFDRRYGARPLQRTLEELVVVPLSRLLLGQPALRNRTLHLETGERDAVCVSVPEQR